MSSSRGLLTGRVARLLVTSCVLGLLLMAGLLAGNATADFGDLVPTVNSVVDLDPSGAYPSSVGATSPPGYALAVAIPVAVLRQFLAPPRAYAWAGLLAPLTLALAAMALARALRLSLAYEALIGVAMLIVPGAPSAVLHRVGADVGIFHPQDVIAAAAMLVGLASAVRGRWIVAGLWLGAAILTRQWAILAALPVVVAAPTERRSILFGALVAVFSLGSLPFLIAEPHGTLSAMFAGNSVSNGQSLTGHFGASSRLTFTVSRIGPVLGALIISVFLAKTWQRRPVTPAGLLGGVLACLALRTALDAAFFPYYLIPISALVLVMTAARMTPTWAGAAWLAAFGALSVTSQANGPIPPIAYAALVFALSAVAVIGGIAVVTRQNPAEAGF